MNRQGFEPANFLLDFSQIIPDPQIAKTEDSSESKYSLTTQMGKLHFEIVEKKSKNISKMNNQQMENIGQIFDQMIQNSQKLKHVIHNLNEIEIT